MADLTPPEWLDQQDDPGPAPDDWGDDPARSANVIPMRRQEPARKDAEQPIIFTPKPFTYCIPADVPPREWLYGHHLIRRYCSATIAPGGAGKTTLTVTDALAMVTGRPLIGVQPHCELRVWLWNGEDPSDELQRRVIATMAFHGIQPKDVGDRLFLDSGRDVPIKIGTSTPNGPMIAHPVIEALIEVIRSRRIDVLIIDPFVSVHSMPENDNGAMDAAVKAFALVADRTGCAIDLVHHSRKLNGADADIDAARGGSAIAGAVRAARVLNVMSAEAAEAYGIASNRRRSFVRVDDAKANLAVASDARWFQLASQPLGNATADRPEDFVAVAAAWEVPDAFDGITVADLLRVQHAVHEKALRENAQANEWVGHVVGPLLRLSSSDKADKGRLKFLIKTWIATGALRIEGVDPAVALVRIGRAAEAREEYGLAVEAYGKVLPFLHAKPRTAADAHPEEALDFAAAMLKARLVAAAAALDNSSLADRLARAKARIVLNEDGSFGAVGLSFGHTGFTHEHDQEEGISFGESAIIDAKPNTPAGSPRPTVAEPPAPKWPRYVPILPTADPVPGAHADWSAPASPIAPWPEDVAFADGRSSFETDPYADDEAGLLAGRS